MCIKSIIFQQVIQRTDFKPLCWAPFLGKGKQILQGLLCSLAGCTGWLAAASSWKLSGTPYLHLFSFQVVSWLPFLKEGHPFHFFSLPMPSTAVRPTVAVLSAESGGLTFTGMAALEKVVYCVEGGPAPQSSSCFPFWEHMCVCSCNMCTAACRRASKKDPEINIQLL